MAELLETRPGAGFEVDGVEVQDGRVLVRGRWSGVRGMRFVRPTLLVAGREVLATLEHKPWSPDADPWVASFPWDGGDLDVRAARLSVAPSVTVRLDGGGTVPTARPAAPRWPAAEPETDGAPPRPEAAGPRERAGAAAAPVAPARAAEDDPIALRARLRGTEAERDALRAQLTEAADERGLLRARLHQAEARTRLLEGRLEALRDAAPAGRLDEAVRDREAAMRAHDRMARQLAEAEAQRDALQAQRDELARTVDALHDRLAQPAPTPLGDVVRHHDEERRPDAPIGVREVPGGRVPGAAPPRGHRPGPGLAERLAVGALAVVVVLCALALLLTFLTSL